MTGALRRVQLAALFAFVVALPLHEPAKNVAAGLVGLAWVAQALLARDAGGPWDRFDSAFGLTVGAALASAWAGAFTGGLSDVLRIVLVAWAVKRSRIDARAASAIVVAACVALLIGLGIGMWQYLRGHTPYLQLASVGHVNQTALYVALLAATTFAWALQGTPSASLRLGVAACAATFAFCLLVTGSRAAILAYAVFVLAYTGVSAAMRRRERRSVMAMAVTAAAGLVIVAGFLAVSRKLPADPSLVSIGAKLTDTRSVQIRSAHWRLAVEAWRERPWLGFGPDSFRSLRPEQACGWRARRGESCDVVRYAWAPHAHSLYFASLSERGAVGTSVLLFLLAAWAWALGSTLRTQLSQPLWAASACALVVVGVGGLFNTTLRVEHGSLALLLLALWLSAGAVGRTRFPGDANRATPRSWPGSFTRDAGVARADARGRLRERGAVECQQGFART